MLKIAAFRLGNLSSLSIETNSLVVLEGTSSVSSIILQRYRELEVSTSVKVVGE